MQNNLDCHIDGPVLAAGNAPRPGMVEQHLPELIELNRLLDEAPVPLSARVAHTVEADGSALRCMY